jgi:probable HAF family extracellular repeat protein
MLCVAGSLVLCGSAAPALAGVTFTPLGDLPGGLFDSIARGVSDDGSVVAGQSMTEGGLAAGFRWSTAGGMSPLPTPEGWPVADCLDISGDGSTMLGTGVTSSGLKNHLAAVYWTRDLAPVSLDAMLEPYSMLSGSTPDASRFVGSDRVGWSHEPGFASSYGFIYSAETGVTYLPDLPGSQGFFVDNCGPADISANGQVIVGFGETSGSIDAVVWRQVQGAWQVQSLGHLPGGFAFSQATAVSADGSHIAGMAATPLGYEPFLWSAEESGGAGAMTSLGTPPHNDFPSGTVSAMRADGRAVIGAWASGPFPSLKAPGIAFIWTANRGLGQLQTMLEQHYDLTLPGWELTAATDMTPDGRVIVGNGVNPQGQREAWMVTFDPSGPQPSDVTGDAIVNVDDLIAVILGWGACPSLPTLCPADANNSGVVDVDDLVVVILNWG